MSLTSGDDRYGDVARRIVRHGNGQRSWLLTYFRNRASFIHGRAIALPSNTQGKSRMQESCTYGSVRGAPGYGRPYRDTWPKLDHIRIFSGCCSGATVSPLLMILNRR